MKIIISGGGTGGHIYPAIAIIEEFQKRNMGNDLLYIGTKNSLEEKLITGLDIPFKSVRVKGMPRKISKSSFIAARELYLGLKDSKKIIKEYQPDLVIGTGGFVTGPILYHASKTNAFTVFHEQNSYPGLTNRILSRYVDKYFITYEETAQYFKYDDRSIVTGNPVRSCFFNLHSKEEDYAFFKLDKNKKTIFSFGGSNGSKSINTIITDMLSKLDYDDFQIIHVTGTLSYPEFTEKLKESKLDQNPSIKYIDYLEAMERAYNIADLVITSSGAISLAEIAYMGKPSILIPKAYTTENHQEINAKLFQNAGASRMILEKDLNDENLYKNIKEILLNDELRVSMGQAAHSLSKPDAAKIIVDKILESSW